MKIHRGREDSDFTILGNALIDDRRLSVLALGLATILLRMPPDAAITLDAIARHRPEGIKTLRRAANELEEAGYLIRTRGRGPGGRITTTTVMYSRPIPEDERPESLAKPWSKAKPKDVSAGHTESPSRKFGQRNFGEPNFGDAHSLDKDVVDKDWEGEDRDARTRASGDPSCGGEPVPGGGVAGQRRYAGVSLASRDLIARIAADTLLVGEGISDEDHTELAALVDAARPVVDSVPGLDWQEYTTWLGYDLVHPDGRPKFKTLPGVLRWRLSADRIRREARQWVAEQRGAQDTSGPRGHREGPQEFGGRDDGGGTCGVHRTRLTSGRCLLCDQEDREALADPVDVDEHEHQDHGDGPDEVDPDLLDRMRASLAGTDEHQDHDHGGGLRSATVQGDLAAALEAMAEASQQWKTSTGDLRRSGGG